MFFLFQSIAFLFWVQSLKMPITKVDTTTPLPFLRLRQPGVMSQPSAFIHQCAAGLLMAAWYNWFLNIVKWLVDHLMQLNSEILLLYNLSIWYKIHVFDFPPNCGLPNPRDVDISLQVTNCNQFSCTWAEYACTQYDCSSNRCSYQPSGFSTLREATVCVCHVGTTLHIGPWWSFDHFVPNRYI